VTVRVVHVDRLRLEAVATRRLARFYDLEARVTGSTHLAQAAAIAYRRAEDLEAEAKGLVA
jgi:hypothetical protein